MGAVLVEELGGKALQSSMVMVRGNHGDVGDGAADDDDDDVIMILLVMVMVIVVMMILMVMMMVMMMVVMMMIKIYTTWRDNCGNFGTKPCAQVVGLYDGHSHGWQPQI